MDESFLWRRFHASEVATVFHIDLVRQASRERQAMDWLDEAERSRRRRFVHPRPGLEFTLCRAALRSLLCRELGCSNDELSFGISKFGKPFARVNGVAAPINFNVSHSGRHGLIALAPKGRIGVDVEERSINRNLDVCIRLLFAPNERAEFEKVSTQDKVEQFYHLWTLKEALIKAVGTGLSIDTAKFEIPLTMVCGGKSGMFRFPDAPAVAWDLNSIGNDEFAAAIAHEHGEELEEIR
ncbi:MAG: 4'-phosphopantetheinyl transferase superfamily protein [Boseongicola sp. SB0673_bin_14]|nr:4'-phosphopantetheinyl transferase superfamily protein [Boseongicola sp. SB0667_bin_21]MYI70005.1 4'-phosphopantetheinyl transferase superfamily protein [Boseongicola sp. SB0673_bin_14]